MINKIILQTDYNFNWLNKNMYEAKLGFEDLGYEDIYKARDKYDLEELVDGHSLVAGNVNFVREGMKLQDIDIPDPIDYPDCLQDNIHRNIEKTKVKNLTFPSFVKPVKHKQFTGDVFITEEEFNNLFGNKPDSEEYVWQGEQVDFVTECRIFVNHDVNNGTGHVRGMKHYAGSWYLRPSGKTLLDIFRNALEGYENHELPVSYAIDVGLRDNWHISVVEVNDAYALGNYGLDVRDYAGMLESRWKDLMKGS